MWALPQNADIMFSLMGKGFILTSGDHYLKPDIYERVAPSVNGQ